MLSQQTKRWCSVLLISALAIPLQMCLALSTGAAIQPDELKLPGLPAPAPAPAESPPENTPTPKPTAKPSTSKLSAAKPSPSKSKTNSTAAPAEGTGVKSKTSNSTSTAIPTKKAPLTGVTPETRNLTLDLLPIDGNETVYIEYERIFAEGQCALFSVNTALKKDHYIGNTSLVVDALRVATNQDYKTLKISGEVNATQYAQDVAECEGQEPEIIQIHEKGSACKPRALAASAKLKNPKKIFENECATNKALTTYTGRTLSADLCYMLFDNLTSRIVDGFEIYAPSTLKECTYSRVLYLVRNPCTSNVTMSIKSVVELDEMCGLAPPPPPPLFTPNVTVRGSQTPSGNGAASMYSGMVLLLGLIPLLTALLLY